ncbi:hypothetical protein [Actinomadura kijaniata]|uniref:hypothetical protein n=1 Tax=Actinomadura kijaniata TaxID=46161 RepID=UPI0008334B87|nr:hypothetical protein [Actinomadura kijaniata]
MAAAELAKALESGWAPFLDQDPAVPPAGHTFTAAPFHQATRDLVEFAVLADRADGVAWADIGAALGLSGDAVRRRYRWLVLHDRTGQSPDIAAADRGREGQV